MPSLRAGRRQGSPTSRSRSATRSTELKEAKQLLDDAGIQCAPVDHEVTQSLYFADPDGNQVELYVDVSDVWKREPQRVAQSSKLEI